MSKKVIKKAYNIIGEYYYKSRKDKSGISYFYNELLEFPTTYKMLGNIKNKKVLDLGCGPGINTKKMYNAGAKIKGIDLSTNLIKIAKTINPKVEFIVGDINKLPYKNKEFDIVVCSLVLGHIKNWNSVLSEIRKVLKKEGLLVFSIHNPVTEKFVKTKWFFKKYRQLKGYFNEDLKRSIWKEEKGKQSEIIHYHKTYGTIIKTLVKNGFKIIDYEDCKPINYSKKIFPKEYSQSLDYPHFCVWKVIKN